MTFESRLIRDAIPEANTKDVTPGGSNKDTINGWESEESRTRAYGYHPQVNRMRIQTEPAAGPKDVLYCHYAPQNFAENYTAHYATVPIDGPGITPVQYKYGNPKKWTMKLLFNDLGAPPNRPDEIRTTEESIQWLFSVMRPSSAGGSRAIPTQAGGSKPPVLVVYLIARWFRCVLTDISINRLAVHPVKMYTTRAEIDVTFVEFVESST